MNILLSTFTDTVLPILILLMGIAAAVFIILFGKKKYSPSKDREYRNLTSEKDISVSPKGRYTTEETMKFLDSLHLALPDAFIAFPNVGVDRVVSPGKNRVAYNYIMSKYLDVVVFLRKSMEPVLVVDLVNSNGTTEEDEIMDKNVVAVLKAIKLNVVSVPMSKAYDIESLRHTLISAIPDKVLVEVNSSIK